MKDLYSALGIDQEAGDDEIAASGKRAPHLEDYASILLNGRKRTLYDRSYTTLKMIGELRHKLGLDSGESWFLEEHTDFAPKLKSTAATASPVNEKEPSPSRPPGEHQEALQASIEKPPPAPRNKRLALVISAIAILIAIALMLKLAL